MECAILSILPVFDPLVPVKVTTGSVDAEAMMEEYLIDRFARGLKTVVPNPDVHESAGAVIMDSLRKLCGSRPLSEKHLKLRVDPIGNEITVDSDEETLSDHIACFLEGGFVDLREGILAFNAVEENLGSEVFARMGRLSDSLPGFISDSSLVCLYEDFRFPDLNYENSDDDARREYLIAEMGYEEEGIDAYLPSTIYREMGGEDIIKFRPTRKRNALANSLFKAFPSGGLRLAYLLSGGLRARINAFHRLRTQFSDGYFVQRYENIQVRISIAPQDTAETALRGFLDDLDQDSMEMGEYDAAFAINHFESPQSDESKRTPSRRECAKVKTQKQKQTPANTDSLKVVAHLVSAMSALDEAISLIQEFGATAHA